MDFAFERTSVPPQTPLLSISIQNLKLLEKNKAGCIRELR